MVYLTKGMLWLVTGAMAMNAESSRILEFLRGVHRGNGAAVDRHFLRQRSRKDLPALFDKGRRRSSWFGFQVDVRVHSVELDVAGAISLEN